MKLTIHNRKPRNRFVAAGLMRLAGPHRTSPSARRQQQQQLLRRELAQYRHSP